jgi:hypothetical protein
MAGELPSGLFSGGAVSLDSRPYVDFTLNALARKQAQDEALSKYYLNLPSTLNQAGIRTNDIQPFMKAQNDMRQFYFQNANAIKDPRVDNWQAYQQYNQLYSNANTILEQSKNRAKKQQEIAQVLADPKRRALVPESSLVMTHLMDLPVTDPRSYKNTGEDYGLEDLNFNAPSATDQDWNRVSSPFAKRIQQGGYDMKELPPTIDPKTHTKIYNTQKTLKPDIAQDILTNAATNYGTNTMWRRTADETFDQTQSNPDLYSYYNNIYKRFYPNKGDIQHPEELLAAQTIAKMGLHNEPEVDQKAVNYNPFLGQHVGRGSGSTGASALWATNATNAVRQGNPDAIKSTFDKLLGGNTNNRYQGFETLPNGHIVIHYTGDRQVGTHTLHGQDLTEELDPNDAALKYRLEGTYQRHMGSDTKGEKQMVESTDTPAPTTTKKPKLF